MNKNQIIYISLLVTGFFSFSQEPIRDNYLHYHIRGITFFGYYDESHINRFNDPYDFQDNTNLYGVNFSVNYNILNRLSFGAGTGLETFENPNFNYVPIFLRIAANSGVRKSSLHAELNFGGHYNIHNKKGFLFRSYFGYRFKIYDKLFGDISLLYTFQNLYKNFENSMRPDDYYNFESVGLSVGISFN